MSMLDEADLWSGHTAAVRWPTHPAVGMAVRFRRDSAFAHDLRVPTDQAGRVTGAYEQDGETRFGVWIEGVGQCSGARREDLERVGQER